MYLRIYVSRVIVVNYVMINEKYFIVKNYLFLIVGFFFLLY